MGMLLRRRAEEDTQKQAQGVTTLNEVAPSVSPKVETETETEKQEVKKSEKKEVKETQTSKKKPGAKK